uniref:Glutaredoxin-like protein n=1 Tax=Cyanistes caeruleus TaxID=156563 RepID=A0A8C0V894_CYACU
MCRIQGHSFQSPVSAKPGPPKVTFQDYEEHSTLKPCPLCDEAKEVLEPYKKRFILQEVDITLPENSGWYDKYKYDIPVFHFNGKFLMKHRVDIQKFEDRLRKLELQSEGSQ